MARTRSISNEQILEAAREIFREQGIEAKTSDIARHAGVSEGTIFARFKTKEALFVEAMAMPKIPVWMATLDERVGEGQVREQLEGLAEQMLDFFMELIPKVHLAMSHSLEIREKIMNQKSSPAVTAIKRISSYVEREQREQRLGPCDPEILGRALMGALHHFAFAELSGVNDQLYMPRATYVRGIVERLFGDLILDEVDTSSATDGGKALG
jgi:AcrR family transcriptional regulator